MNKFFSLFLTVLLLPGYSRAAEEVDCSESCAAGERMISFADGDTTTCACVEEGEGMDETQADESAPSPGESDV